MSRRWHHGGLDGNARVPASEGAAAGLDFSRPAVVAAALLAHADQAPPELNAAVLLLVRDTLRVVPSKDRLSVDWTATTHLPLEDGGTGTYELTGVIGSRWRHGSKASSSWTTCVDTARRYLAAPAEPDGTAVTFEACGPRTAAGAPGPARRRWRGR